MGHRVAVLGASGYAGGELVRLIDDHPGLDLVYLGAHSKQGGVLGDVHPHLAVSDRPLGSNEADDVPEVDLVFLALPHGASWAPADALARRGSMVVDLGSDYRLDTNQRYVEAYGSDHPLPDRLPEWRYGLPELFDLSGADLVASPGCYPTAVLLGLVPLIRAGLVGDGVVVADCLSGVSGAGRSLKEDLLFGSIAEGVRAYSVTSHRHRPEIEMAIEHATGTARNVVFTPHLLPMQRGELATVTVAGSPGISEADVRAALRDAYDKSTFVDVIERPPQTRWVVGSNRALVCGFFDQAAGSIVVQGAIDNLVKGAAGQAVQAANIMLGLDEAAGLPLSGWMP